MTVMKKIEVKASKNYTIHIGEGLLSSAGEIIKKTIGVCSAVIVTDNVVNLLYGNEVEKSLVKSGFSVSRYVIKSGEPSKDMNTLTRLLNFFASQNIARTDAVVALGGGVVGDIAGFAAAVYLRGIKLVQIPTTLLAAVDSSVGGKTAVNLEKGKNLAGAFYQPDVVICDYSTLSTLSHGVFADGCAEVIKYGMILDKEFFEFLQDNDIKNNLEHVISRCVTLKRDIVGNDEFEKDSRRLLNFGHTIGHAIEKCSKYKIPHGSAVAMGMVIVSRGAYKLGVCREDYSPEIARLLAKNSLPATCDFPAKQLYQAALADKKRKGSSIALVLPEEIGKCRVHEIGIDELLQFIEKGLG